MNMLSEDDTTTDERSQQKYAERVYVPRQQSATSELSAAEAGEESDASGQGVVEVRVDAHATDEMEGESKETAEVQMADMRLAVDLATLGSAEGKHGAVEFWTKEAANDTWYFVDTSQATHGPAEVSVLKSAFAAKTLADDCRVWNGTSQMSWTPLRKVSALYSQLQAATGPPTAAPNTTAQYMNVPVELVVASAIGWTPNHDAAVELESKNVVELETLDLVRLSPEVADLLAKARELLPQSKNVSDIVLEGGQSVAHVIVDACPVSNLPFDVADIIVSFTPPSHSFANCTFWLKASSFSSAPPSFLLHWLFGFRTATHNTTVINYVPIWQWLVFKLVFFWLLLTAVPILICLSYFATGLTIGLITLVLYEAIREYPGIQCNPGFWLSAPSMDFQHSDNSILFENRCCCCGCAQSRKLEMKKQSFESRRIYDFGIGTKPLICFPEWNGDENAVVNLLVQEIRAALLQSTTLPYDSI